MSSQPSGVRSIFGADAIDDLNKAHAQQVQRIAEHGYGSVENFFHIVGSASKLANFRRALDRARPVTYGQTRAFVAGYLSALSHAFGEREITALADLAYAELPWRAEHLLIAAE